MKNPLPLDKENELIAAAQAGDSAAESELYLAYEPLLRKLCSDVCSRDELDDATQIAAIKFVRLLRTRKNVNVPLAALVRTRIGPYVSSEIARSKTREEELVEPVRIAVESGADDVAISNELTSLATGAIARCVRTLSPRDQLWLHEVYSVGRTAADVAREHGVDPSAVSHRFTKVILPALREALTDTGITADDVEDIDARQIDLGDINARRLSA